jgi:uncharacterized protein
MSATTVTTISGRSVDLSAPDPRSICVEDIAYALARINRWSGHFPGTRSVAAHSIRVVGMLHHETPRVQLHGLLHDAAEAYLGDITRPVRRLLGEQLIALTEYRLLGAIYAALRVPRPTHVESMLVSRADELALAEERQDMLTMRLRPRFPPYDDHQAKYREDLFLRLFDRLSGGTDACDDDATNPFFSP